LTKKIIRLLCTASLSTTIIDGFRKENGLQVDDALSADCSTTTIAKSIIIHDLRKHVRTKFVGHCSREYWNVVEFSLDEEVSWSSSDINAVNEGAKLRVNRVIPRKLNQTEKKRSAELVH
jgi:hypothetical protein